MEQAQFEETVKRMEGLNQSSPKEYRKRVQRFIKLGYGAYLSGFVLVVLILVAIVWAMIATGFKAGLIKLLVVFGGLSVMFVRAMWIKLEPPEGREIKPQDAPELHKELERMRAAIGAPPIEKVLLNDDFNAFATSSTKFAIFGSRCYVVLGLPLMITQKKEEIDATIAHELAHHSESHVKSGIDVYRLNVMWHKLYEQVAQQEGIMAAPLKAFLKWYVPRLSAMTYVLRRQAEFEADAVGAKVTSKESMALGLVRMDIDLEHRLRAYFGEVRKGVQTSDSPPDGYYRGLVNFPTEQSDSVRETLVRKLRWETDYDDSHPSLRERTDALGFSANPDDEKDVDALLNALDKVEVSAAEHYFGERLNKVLTQVDAKWNREALSWWKDERKEFLVSEKTLLDLADKDDSALTLEECQKKASAHMTVLTPSQAFQQVLVLQQRFPDDPKLLFYAGVCLAQANDRRALDFLTRAAESDLKFARRAFEYITVFHRESGDRQAARASDERADEIAAKEYEEYLKLCDLVPGETRHPANLSQQQIEETRNALKDLSKIVSGYAYQKKSDQMGLTADIAVLIVDVPKFVKSHDEFVRRQTEAASTALRSLPFDFVIVIDDESALARDLVNNGQYQVFVRTLSKPTKTTTTGSTTK